MHELAELHRFNAWANRGLLAALRQLSQDQLEDRLEGMYGSILGVMNHLAEVEAVYVAMMRREAAERLEQQDLDGLGEVLAGTGAGLVDLARTADMAATFHIPWFDREITVFQGLGQVLTHSINHRADVNQWLPRFGVQSSDQDYIDLVLEEA
jgi:uncharacterized damage-inducible protein DinB